MPHFPRSKGKADGAQGHESTVNTGWLGGMRMRWRTADGEGIKNPQLSLAIKIITPIDCSKVTKATAIKHFRCFGFFFFFFYQSQYKHSTMEGAKTSVCLCISISMQTFFYIIIFIYRYYTYPTGSVFRVSLCYY